MPAGLNLLGCVWRYYYPQDDSIGGAVPSGTLLYQDISARISSQRPISALLAQGVESIALYTALVWPSSMEISENDQFEVTQPQISPYYGKKFIILGVQHTSIHPASGQGYLILTMRRNEEARSVQSIG
jgi:hypothetical protein